MRVIVFLLLIFPLISVGEILPSSAKYSIRKDFDVIVQQTIKDEDYSHTSSSMFNASYSCHRKAMSKSPNHKKVVNAAKVLASPSWLPTPFLDSRAILHLIDTQLKISESMFCQLGSTWHEKTIKTNAARGGLQFKLDLDTIVDTFFNLAPYYLPAPSEVLSESAEEIEEFDDDLVTYGNSSVSKRCQRDVDFIFLIYHALNSTRDTNHVLRKALNNNNENILSSFNKMWPISLLDSWGKTADALLAGSFYNFYGNMKECFNVNTGRWASSSRDLLEYSFRGQFCTIDIAKKEEGEDSSIAVFPKSYGTCIPSSCTTQELKVGIQAQLDAFGQSVTSVYCQKEEDKTPFETWEIVATTYISLSIAICCLASLAIYLSVIYNLDKILTIRTPKEGDITCINGIRVLSICWIAMGHQWAYMSQHTSNMLQIEELVSQWHFQIVWSGYRAVDSFFLIGGFLFTKFMITKPVFVDHEHKTTKSLESEKEVNVEDGTFAAPKSGHVMAGEENLVHENETGVQKGWDEFSSVNPKGEADVSEGKATLLAAPFKEGDSTSEEVAPARGDGSTTSREVAPAQEGWLKTSKKEVDPDTTSDEAVTVIKDPNYLNVEIASKVIEKQGRHTVLIFLKNYFTYIYIRLIRLFPTILFVVIFLAGWSKFLVHGPQRGKYVEGPLKLCRKYWYLDISFINNILLKVFAHTKEESVNSCIPHVWYVGVDFQIQLVFPILLLPMFFIKRKILYLTSMMIIFSLIPGIIIVTKDLFAAMYLSIDGEALVEFSQDVYIMPYTHVAPYFVGAILSLTLSYLKEGTNPSIKRLLGYKLFRHSISFVVAVTFCVLIFCLASVNKYTVFDKDLGPVGNFVYGGFSSTVWALCLSWVILLCHTGYGGFVDSFLSHPLWQPMSKLTFSVYLFHLPLMFMIFYSFEAPVFFTTSTVTMGWLSTLCFSYFAALFISIFSESPPMNLLKLKMG